MKLKLIGNRVIVKDDPIKNQTEGLIVQKDNIPEIISGVVQYAPQGSNLENTRVYYTKTTGSTFRMNNEVFRSIKDPLENLMFVEE